MIFLDAAQDAPPVIIVPAKKKKGRRSRATSAAFVIGSIWLLADGRRCQIVGYDRKGRPICTQITD